MYILQFNEFNHYVLLSDWAFFQMQRQGDAQKMETKKTTKEPQARYATAQKGSQDGF
jgi:hypothetical protein